MSKTLDKMVEDAVAMINTPSGRVDEYGAPVNHTIGMANLSFEMGTMTVTANLIDQVTRGKNHIRMVYYVNGLPRERTVLERLFAAENK